ncbi:hypothetical protein MHYP_G00039770 [Metynnis hypsauchen]
MTTAPTIQSENEQEATGALRKPRERVRLAGGESAPFRTQVTAVELRVILPSSFRSGENLQLVKQNRLVEHTELTWNKMATHQQPCMKSRSNRADPCSSFRVNSAFLAAMHVKAALLRLRCFFMFLCASPSCARKQLCNNQIVAHGHISSNAGRTWRNPAGSDAESLFNPIQQLRYPHRPREGSSEQQEVDCNRQNACIRCPGFPLHTHAVMKWE